MRTIDLNNIINFNINGSYFQVFSSATDLIIYIGRVQPDFESKVLPYWRVSKYHPAIFIKTSIFDIIFKLLSQSRESPNLALFASETYG